MKPRLLVIILSLIVFENIVAQNFFVKQYRVSEGLPIDVIKAISQDSLGFFWIATDDGLVKYDGVNFTTYRSALKSKYVKAFLKTSDKKLLVIGDLDLVEIDNRLDTVVFKSLLKGNHILTDSTISYPKNIYQDRNDNIWMAESESVVKYKKGKMQRYFFGREFSSNDFNRSFQFFEDGNNNLYISSYGGKVFHFNAYRDKFELVKGELCGGINHIISLNDKLIIASNLGLYTAKVDKWNVSDLQQINFPFKYISSLLIGKDSSLWVGTFSSHIYRINNVNQLDGQKLSFNFTRTNSAYMSNEGDLWMSTDKGLILFQTQIFKSPIQDVETKYTESIIQGDSPNKIYYCDKGTIFKLFLNENSNWERKKINDSDKGYFQTLIQNNKGIWATDAFGVLLFKDDKLFKKWDFSQSGHYIFDLLCDSQNNIWVAQSKSNTLLRIDSNFTEYRFNIPISSGSDIRVVMESDKGIFIGAKGSIQEYLFFKAKGSSEFKNISLPISFNTSNEIQISNLAVVKNVLWIASSLGLLKYENGNLERVDIGENFTTINVSSVYKLNEENILFANSYGLFRYNTKTNEYWVYDENMGLPANTIADHGIFVDDLERVWIGTSHGVCYTSKSDLLVTQNTFKPYCISAKVNGKPILYTNGLVAPYGAYVNLIFNSISFPENKISLQWKWDDGNSTWVDMKNHELNFSDLNDGEYKLLIRAKKNTGLSWSEPTRINITIGKPFWMSPVFILVIIIGVLIVSWLSYVISAKIMSKSREYLQNLVKLRTQDLEAANQELSQRNLELDRFVYSASHDLGAPLKSLLGLITIAKMEESRTVIERYLGMMEGSVKKLDEFIKEVISYSRNSRMELKFDEIEFKPLIDNLLEDHKYAENFSNINFIIEDYTEGKMISDVSRLKIILNNLISNAIKFHRFDENTKPFVRIVLQNNHTEYRLVVEDNGRGIPSEHLNSIFNMFFRAAEDVQGSGLGLYILKETITKLNGTCKVESELHKGTRFIITLPLPIKQN